MDVFPWGFEEELFLLLCHEEMEMMAEEKIDGGMEGKRRDIRTIM